MVIANLLVFRGLRPAKPPLNPPLVSILIPARNEELNIQACLSSLLAQDYPNWELIVLNDNSQDETGRIARQLTDAAKLGSRATVINGTELPAGWTGKNWACHQLARQAKGEYLFFTDADTKHKPGMVAAAIQFSESQNADLVSAWPRFVTCTLGEKLIIPVIGLVGFAFVAHWLVAVLQKFPGIAKVLGTRFTRALGTANGQFMFFKRSCYDRIGGHECVRANVVEDVALGREVSARMGEGLRLSVCEGFRFSEVRMYRSFLETWNGFSKNLRAMFEGQWLVFWLFLLGLWAFFLAPFVKWSWVSGVSRESVLWQIAIILGIRFIVTLRLRTSWIGALMHPVGVALVMAIGVRSWWLSRGRGVEWKGRIYKFNS